MSSRLRLPNSCGGALDWLRENHGWYEFWVERDLVWTVQTRLRQVVWERGLPFFVRSLPPQPPDNLDQAVASIPEPEVPHGSDLGLRLSQAHH
jgi:hypothetical protein